VLTFESGRRVVYKPKDLRCAYQFLDLLAFLNADARSINLPTRQILCRGSYAWEEYVDERVAVIDAEVSSFFKRFGMFLRVLQLVEGRDFWLDNLRICGGLPIFVDLECILHPRLRTEGVGRLIMGLEPEVYQESVLPTAAVTHPIDIPGGGRQDFGGLSSPGPRLLPLGVWSGYRDQKNGNFWLQQGRIYWNPELAWPQPDGKLANPVAYLDELESGYRETQLLLCQRASGLLGPASPLAGMSNVPVRVLMRSTWEYLVLLRASLEPTALLDGNARELALANVLSSSPTWGGGDDGGRRLAISCSELIALRTLDIPQFYSLPSSTSVMDTSHSEIADVFDGTADDRLRRRLTEVDSFDIETHARILRDAVNSIARG
ncbi:MAG TPA: type 2 lanthipeptide synthetase LanM, partial [Candidatus Acidoferrum sp.]|nr:type 2 lanthipeptide synthetase LanM [Candidatus Acidoferrum sp.]